MKKLLLFAYACVACLAANAQTSVLADGDYVTICFAISNYYNSELNATVPLQKFYLEASQNGLRTSTTVNKNCLWKLGIANSTYTLQDLTTNKYLSIANHSTAYHALQLANSPTTFSFSMAQNQDLNQLETQKYLYGQLYFLYYTQESYGPQEKKAWVMYEWVNGAPMFKSNNTWGNDIYLEKWEKTGSDVPTGEFAPTRMNFGYNTTNAQTATFSFNNVVNVGYQCVRDPSITIWQGQDTISADIQPIFYWRSDSVEKSEYSTLDENKYLPGVEIDDDNKHILQYSSQANNNNYTVTITPIGKSPLNLSHENNAWVDYEDYLVAEYTYNGITYKKQLDVKRFSYHKDTLPSFVITVNPLTYTFSKAEEAKTFEIIATHQHGSAIYDITNKKVDVQYTTNPENIQWHYSKNTNEVSDGSWVLALELDDNWGNALQLPDQGGVNNGLRISVDDNTTKRKRSATLTGTLTKTLQDEHAHSGTFTIQLHQRGEEGGIQFIPNKGAGNTKFEQNPYDKRNQQAVHTAERTIYYEAGQEIELKLAESNFYGYMRWYDYKTGMDPYYNENPTDSTSWIRSPRAANNAPFSAINTPRDASNESLAADGRSYGWYAISKNKSDGVLDEIAADNQNQSPILKGWTNGAAHTMACDVSAYTDYTIWTSQNGVRIDSIMEPTLSYRQLFHLRPASEMADTLTARSSREQYLEEYSYQAPINRTIPLTPQYQYRQTSTTPLSELCYFYKDNDIIKRVTNAYWSGGGTDKGEYLEVLSSQPGTQTYTLTANNGELLLAKFTVQFKDNHYDNQGPNYCGPSPLIISKERIRNEYKILANIDFNYTDSTKMVPLSDGNYYYNQPLDWEESTYGFVYPTGNLASDYYVRAATQGVFPFYGEYCLVNRVNKSWSNEAYVNAEQHGGANNGFALYVDGTTEPGLVASISTDAVICSGQTMYCSAWFCNPSSKGHEGAVPIFRCNVQGRERIDEKTWGEWQDAGVFFVGAIDKASGWKQINFPIESAHTYDATRVSIYNFATAGSANDFMVDDICLYASHLPIAAYQGKMACRSVEDTITSAAAVLRLDYSNINVGDEGYMFYQIFNETKGKPVILTGDAAYYHDYDHEHNSDTVHPYGSIHIPPTNYDPIAENVKLKEKGQDTLLIYYSVSKLLDDMVLHGHRHAKAFIQTTNGDVTKWLMYVAHIIENTDVESLALTKLHDSNSYTMRMAYSANELETPECNLQTPLYATQQTVFRLRNSEQQLITHTNESGELKAEGTAQDATIEGINIFDNSKENCANDLYSLTATVVNHLAVEGVGTMPENVYAPIFADWLVGDPAGDVLSEQAPVRDNYTTDEKYNAALNDYNNRLQASIEGFKTMYGYTHGQISSAIMYDLRRVPTADEPNPNYEAQTFKEIRPDVMLDNHYEIIKHLYDNGWLQLYDTTVQFYLGSADTARYWCFPIAETAKAKVKIGGNDTIITIKDCNEPHRVYVTSVSSDYYLNVAPIDKDTLTAQQKIQLPTVKMPQNSNQIDLPIKNIAENNVTIGGEAYLSKDTIKIDLSNLSNLPSYLSFYEPKEVTQLEAGKEYIMRLQLHDANGEPNLSDNLSGNSCKVGYVFFKIAVVPQTLVWQPTGTSFNGWGKNENWKGWVDANNDGIPNNGDTFTEGYVPIIGVNVVLPYLSDPRLYPYIVPEHEHNHYPMTINHEAHNCNNIYFAAGALLDNQHLLEYDSAFVDMPLVPGGWHLMSAPLQQMYAGDMFIPHQGTSYTDTTAKSTESTNPFVVKGFEGVRSSSAPYAFWASYYNQDVKTWYEDGTYSTDESTSATFLQSNGLNQPLELGAGYALWGEGIGEDTLTIRLPKPDTQYTYSGGSTTTVARDNKGHKFAFTATHGNQQMQLTLQNKVASQHFVMGNPTMAYIDLLKLYNDNKSDLSGKFYRMQGSTVLPSTILTLFPAERYLPPMTAVLVESKEESTSLELKLTPSHLTLDNSIISLSEDEATTILQTPVRKKISANRSVESELMTIYAFVEGASARTVLATNPIANDYYQAGEDALFLSSGIESESYVTTPLNMYTVAERVPMMADVRQGISRIPLSMLVAPDYRSERMKLAFYLSINWTRECYLYDSATGNYTRILNGLVVDIEMPENHEERYYIEGPDEYLGSSDDQGPTTAVDNTVSSSASATLQAFSLAQGELTVSSNHLIQEVRIYDLAGRLILDQPLTLLHTTTTVAAPSGICLVEAILRDGTTLHTQALVK